MRRPPTRRRPIAGPLATGVTLLGLLVLAMPSRAAVPLEDIAPRAHRAPAGATLDDIRASIIRGASEAGWALEASSLETVRVSIQGEAEQRATVDIRFDDETFAIRYVDSVDLDYSETGVAGPRRSQKSTLRRLSTEQTMQLGPKIDARYNEWIATLADRVARRIAAPLPSRPLAPARASSPAPATGPAAGTEATPTMIADELEKLDALRRRGVLTEAEFQAQKAKLLAR